MQTLFLALFIHVLSVVVNAVKAKRTFKNHKLRSLAALRFEKCPKKMLNIAPASRDNTFDPSNI
jgi:hypothetical protein